MRLLQVVALSVLTVAPACPQGVDWVRANYTKHEFRVPMRDGKHLFTAVYTPKDRSKAYPFLLSRTPYSVAPYGTGNYRPSLGPSEEFAKDGYIFVYQDVRGRFLSEGTFLEMTPHKPEKRRPADVDESSDTFDTIEWLLKNVPGNNGRAGIVGVSYGGFYAAAALPGAHPALKAASPQAPIIDLFNGDDAFHNGAFYLAANFGFYGFFDEHKEPQRPRQRPGIDMGTPDAYEFFLNLGPVSNADEKYFRFQNPYWTALTRNTNFNAFWKDRNLAQHLKDVTPAVLSVGGWFDAEDLAGPLTLWRSARAGAPKGPVTLVMGPWSHGQWSRGDANELGPVRFQVKNGPYFRSQVQFPFFQHHLKDAPDPKLPAAVVFRTGANEWHKFDEWPPKTARKRTLYFHESGRLSFDPPAARAGHDDYISDPARPVPFTSFTTRGMAREYMVDDQRHAARRPDVLVYQTEPLEEDVTLGGPLTPRLFVSTSGTDADWIVKLIDVYPDDYPDPDPNPAGMKMGGYQQLLRGEPFRGRFWKGFESPAPLPANEFVKIEYMMPDVFHTFRRGHRIMVQVQSSWFPLVDRNPQTFVANIPDARPADFVKALQRVKREAGAASGLDVFEIR
ncbi:MAG: CocE/NonD family hydrolase [Bryobacteraceae bacterium]|nr:CocE/NonD family hydrolase [Bryobacteraceae bacterium]